MEYGLIAEKLSHSFSKEIHNKLADYIYELKELKKEELKAFILKKEFKAINVTIPYKEAVMPYLDEIDDKARLIGSVNTIVNNNGKLYGYNTDFFGMKQLILKNGISLKDKKVLILGSGGTAKTAFAVSKHLGANEIYYVSRSKTQTTVTYDEALNNHADAHVIINTTPVGMFPSIDKTPIDLKPFKNLSAVIDVIYNPLKTQFLLNAEELGIKAVGGLYMLVSQAKVACEYFLNKNIDDSMMETVFKDILSSKQNVVFVGMPSSGKSTVGKLVAEKLSRKFYDTDLLIYEKTGKTPAEIINGRGEKEFRLIESEVISEISKLSGIVIATGGGAILNDENIKNLKKNGLIWFIDRPIESLETGPDRPLSSNKNQLIKRYNERYPKYNACADFVLKDFETPTLAAEQTVKDLCL